jgi:transcription initiation factor TFIID TATA-box-binding protein
MNCVGARSMEDAKMAIKKLTKNLKRVGVKIKKDPKVEVQNIVASFDLGGSSTWRG